MEGLTTPHRRNETVTNSLDKPRNWTDSLVRHQQTNKDMRFGTWNVTSLYRTGTVANIQAGREISGIILTDDYLRYKEPKSPYTFLFQYLTNYLSLKLRTNGIVERWDALLCTVRTSTFTLHSHKDPFAFFRPEN